MFLAQLIKSDLSSVGRAEDCSCSNLSSLGRWFESGRSDFQTFDFSRRLNYYPSVKSFLTPFACSQFYTVTPTHGKYGVFTRKKKYLYYIFKYQNPWKIENRSLTYFLEKKIKHEFKMNCILKKKQIISTWFLQNLSSIVTERRRNKKLPISNRLMFNKWIPNFLSHSA